MNMRMRIGFYVMLGFIVCHSGSLSARHSTHGTDNRAADENAAWFLGGERSIKYCIDAASNFGFTKLDINEKIVSALATWESYMKDRLPAATFMASPDRQLTTKGALVECDGTEDLKFYFGTSDGTVENFKKFYTDPVAFAQRMAYDPVEGWGKGFIWFTEPRALTFLTPGKTEVSLQWDQPYLLDAIIRHEIGHIFGIEHVPGTIMDEHLLYRAFGPQLFSKSCPKYSPYLQEIDDVHELLPCYDCNKIGGRERVWQGVLNDTYFKYVMGRSSQGEVSAKLIERTVEYHGKSRKHLEMIVKDSVGSTNADLSPLAKVVRSAVNGTIVIPHVFKTFMHTGSEGAMHPVVSYFEPASYMMETLTAPGRRIGSWLQYNLQSQNSPVRIATPTDIAFESYSSVIKDGCVIPKHPNSFK